MSAADTVNVGQALETLVHQFADPWSFLRELIQNAIDAGSREIDVYLDHEPPTGADEGPGLMVVEVVDSGEGMDREIIDTRLTRLFSSAKDGDYTKIGRFGIGFVSVFAIGPDLVCVDTGRTGEYWRVLFRADRSFERIRLDMPVEGTTIKIYKQADADAVEEARARAGRVLEYWCKHAEIEIRLDDEPVSRPLGLDAHCVVEHEEEGTKVMLGLVEQAEALRGYYHGGLTLHEERDDRLPHVAFKIDSRYLEHTLTRDNVIRDDNYDKAWAIVTRLTATKLSEALFAELEQIAKHPPRCAPAGEPVSEAQLRWDFLHRRACDAPGLEGELEDQLLARAIVPVIGGPPISLADCRKAKKRGLWVALEDSPVVAALRARGETVIYGRDESPLIWLVATRAGQPPRRVQDLCTALPATSVEVQRWQPLRAALAKLLAGRAKLASVELGHLAYPESSVADRVAISQGEFGELSSVEEIGELTAGWFASKRVIVLNADHPTVVHLLELAEREAELAAYLILKLFYLRSELSSELDSALATAAAQARWAGS